MAPFLFIAAIFVMSLRRTNAFSIASLPQLQHGASLRPAVCSIVSAYDASLPHRYPSSVCFLQMTSSSSSPSSPPPSSSEEDDDKREPLTPEKIAEMIEVSFVEGVMQLSQGYVETLKLFIAAVLTGYGVCMSINDLVQLVRNCPNQSANRPLLPEEEDLRRTWMKLVYLVAHDVQYRQAIVQNAQLLADSDSKNDNETQQEDMYRAMLPRLRQRHARGDDKGPKFRAQEFWEQHMDVIANDIQKDAMQKALVLQNMRVLWMTLTVLEEEKLASSSSVDTPPPAPPIPNKL